MKLKTPPPCLVAILAAVESRYNVTLWKKD